jgi:hypothetical protein
MPCVPIGFVEHMDQDVEEHDIGSRPPRHVSRRVYVKGIDRRARVIPRSPIPLNDLSARFIRRARHRIEVAGGIKPSAPAIGNRVGVNLRTLRDCLDPLERAEHVPLISAFSQETPEWVPDLCEEVVAQVESLGDVGSAVAGSTKFVAPGVDRPIPHDDGELEHLSPLALGHFARGPVENRPVLVALYVAPVSCTNRRTRRAIKPLGLNHLGTVLAHLRDVADELPNPHWRCIDVECDFSAHGDRP